MDVLQQTLDKVLATLPAVTVEKLIAKKLREQGDQVSEDAAETTR
jgi:hypothetical protein